MTAVGLSASTLARDHSVNLVYLASSVEPRRDAALSELKASEWASGRACGLGWLSVVWCNDAKNLIKDVEPIG